MEFKIVNSATGNDATESQVFGYIAFKLMSQAIDQLTEKGEVVLNGNRFELTEEALGKLNGMKSHIAKRWDKPVKPEKIVRKSADLEWEI